MNSSRVINYVNSTGALDRQIGVVIPVYNRRTILLETLEHVLAQSMPPEKLVIVDDGSIDGTPVAAENWLAQAHPQFEWEVVRASHKTAAAARNIGLERVRSLPLVAFLDSDDHWPNDFLERAVTTLVANPDAVAASADRRFLDAHGRCVEENDLRKLVSDPVTWFFQHGAGIASCSLVWTAAVIEAGAWGESIETAEDAVLFSSVALLGSWVHVPGQPVAFHQGVGKTRQEENNLSVRNADYHLDWAQVFERIYETVCTQRPEIPRSRLRRAIALRWYWAGKQLLTLGRSPEGGQCFRRALHWQPTMFRAWRRLAASGPSSWKESL